MVSESVFPQHTSVFAVFQHILWDTDTLPPSVIANEAHLHVQIEFSTVTANYAYLSIQHILYLWTYSVLSVTFMAFPVKASGLDL